MRPVLSALALALALLSPSPTRAADLTADEAVRLALQRNSQAVSAEASVLDARGGLWGAYAGVLPSISANYNYTRSVTDPSDRTQTTYFGPLPVDYRTLSSSSTTTAPSITGRWSLVDLSGWSALSSARQGMAASQAARRATRQDIVLETKRRFYDVVRSWRLAEVSAGALKLARDDERRVRALFEVGSVSKSDLLKARVRTSQSELDSLVSRNAVTNSRIHLATFLGIAEGEMSAVDTTLVAERRTYDAAAVLAEARASRPDLEAAERDVKAAQAGLNAARWRRLPALDVTAAASFPAKTKSESEIAFADSNGNFSDRQVQDVENTSDTRYSATLAFSVPIFDGFATDAQIASARARLLRSRETRDALLRNLDSEVRQALLQYQEAVEREVLGRRTLESAAENLNLVQQKYNVGSSTILDLIDAQVQLQRAQSDLVSAQAAIRVADATLDRVRGRGE